MPLWVQKAKTTHFRLGGNGWFRACWEIPNPGNTEKSVATRFYESLIVLHHSSVIGEVSDENVTLLMPDF